MQDFSRRDTLKWALGATAGIGIGGFVLNRHDADAGTLAASTYEYKGRRITLQSPVQPGAGLAASLMSAVLIDGRPLHVMRYPDGRFTSVMNHFQTFPTLRATADAAVDALMGANLVPVHHHN